MPRHHTRPRSSPSTALLGVLALLATLLVPGTAAATAGDPHAAAVDTELRPVIFVHGQSGSVTQFQSHAMRFTSNGYPAELIHGFEYDTGQRGDEYQQQVISQLDATIDALLAEHDSDQVDLVGHSRGTGVSLDYLADEDRADKVATYVNIDGSAGRETVDGVRVLGVWGEGSAEREIVDAERNVQFAGQGHTEVATSAETFGAMYDFIHGEAAATTDIVPEDEVTIAGRATLFPQNVGVEDATVTVYALDAATGHRTDDAPVATATLPEDGSWGPFEIDPETHYELELTRDDTDLAHHFYSEPFERSNHWVRLQTSNPGEGVALLIEDGPDHSAFVITRDMEWWGDQGEGSDTLELDGTNIVNEATSPRTDRNIAVFAFDDDSDGVSNPDQKLPIFTTPLTTFLTGVDIHLAAETGGPDTIELVSTMRGEHTTTLNVPNWPSDQHRISVQLNDYVPVQAPAPQPWEPPTDPHSLRPVIFVHGGGGSATQFESHAMRFTSNGVPQELLHVFEYDTARGHAEQDAQINEALEALIREVLDTTGADRVNLAGHSRGTTVSHSFLNSSSERANLVANYVNLDGGGGPDAPGGVRTLAIWGEGGEDRAIEGAENLRYPDQGHTEVATSATTFGDMYEFYLGEAPTTTDVVPEDEVTIAGRAATFQDNLGVGGGTVQVFEVAADTGHRIDDEPVATATLPEDGSWGPFDVDPAAHHEFELSRDDTDLLHHFYLQPFERTNHFVRLQTSDPGSGVALLIEDGPDHTALVITRNREWWGDQGDGSDRLEIAGTNVMTPGVSPRSDRNIAVFVFDADSDGESDPETKLPLFRLPVTTFLTGVDLYLPAAEGGSGSIEIANTPRGGDVTEVVNVPNWPSDEHRVSISFRDYRSIAGDPTDPADPGTPTPPPFRDIAGNVHADDIRSLQLLGIVRGFDGDRFGPFEHLRRDQMASMVARTLGLDPVASGPFSDVAGSPHEGAINALAAAGITLGTEDGGFAPLEHIRRDQLSAFIGRALELEPVTSGPFTDVTGSVHEGWINAMSQRDVVRGWADGTFRPRLEVQRDQAAAMLARSLPLLADAG